MLAELVGLGEEVARLRAGFAAAQGASARAAWSGLAARGRLHPDALFPALELPGAFAETLGAALALEEREGTPRAEQLRAHYLERMPRAHVEQLATLDEPNATIFHTPLELARLPRLAGALARLYQLVEEAGVDPAAALPASSPAALLEGHPTLARLYGATHYGGFMPLLYGTPADLARAARSGRPPLETIDRHLTAPIIHELSHFARGRLGSLPLYLDEGVAGHLGVVVHPAFAYPGPDDDDGLYATPWFAQVGQALARVVGRRALVRAQTGVVAWAEVLPSGFLEAALRLAWEDYRERRGPHFLSDSFRPDPWLKLILGARGDRAALDALPWSALPPPPPDVEADVATIADALRAMCLENVVEEGAYRVRTRLPAGPVHIDVGARRMFCAPRPGTADLVSPAYHFPQAPAQALEASGLSELSFAVDDLARIPALAAGLVQPIVVGPGPG